MQACSTADKIVAAHDLSIFVMQICERHANVRIKLGVTKEALGNKVVKRSLRSDLFLMNVLGAD